MDGKMTEVSFFVSGINAKERGLYIAKNIRLNSGVEYAEFQPRWQLVKVSYNPDIIDHEAIVRYGNMHGCKLISEPGYIRKCQKMMKRVYWLDIAITVEIAIFLFLLVYLVTGALTGCEHYYSEYTLFVLAFIVLLITYLWRERLLLKINKSSY